MSIKLTLGCCAQHSTSNSATQLYRDMRALYLQKEHEAIFDAVGTHGQLHGYATGPGVPWTGDHFFIVDALV